MESKLGSLQRPPEARAESVEALIEQARQGRIRIPDFQRALRWKTPQVVDLFDSIYRGLPVGSLLLWKQKAEAGNVALGPLSLKVPEVPEAWWVVDGQQRLASLAVCLLRPLPLPDRPDPKDPFIVYFAAGPGEFRPPPRVGSIPVDWVPLPALLDAGRLSEWVHQWPLSREKDLRQRVFEAGKRVRDYKLPLYLVETTDRDLLREIFFRVNNTGLPMTWPEIHDALYGHDGPAPSTIAELGRELGALKMGCPDPGTLTNCLLALRGLDVTKKLAEHRRKNPQILRGAAAEALPVLKQGLTFLSTRAAIPHLRLLPRSFILEVLTRFFGRHSEPHDRSLQLLSRWVWRVLVGERHFDERTLERNAISAINDDEESSIQALLKLVPSGASPSDQGTASRIAAMELPKAFDARTSGSRVALLALASLGPRHLGDGRVIDIADLIETDQTEAFKQIVRVRPGSPKAARGIENRVFHPGSGTFRRVILDRIATKGIDDAILRTHGIEPHVAEALAEGDTTEFLRLRREAIGRALVGLADRLSGWSRHDRDRPSITQLLRQAELPL